MHFFVKIEIYYTSKNAIFTLYDTREIYLRNAYFTPILFLSKQPHKNSKITPKIPNTAAEIREIK